MWKQISKFWMTILRNCHWERGLWWTEKGGEITFQHLVQILICQKCDLPPFDLWWKYLVRKVATTLMRWDNVRGSSNFTAKWRGRERGSFLWIFICHSSANWLNLNFSSSWCWTGRHRYQESKFKTTKLNWTGNLFATGLRLWMKKEYAIPMQRSIG